MNAALPSTVHLEHHHCLFLPGLELWLLWLVQDNLHDDFVFDFQWKEISFNKAQKGL